LQRGQNLFHSFTDFSIPTGGAANFTNPAGNQSIISRVTGNLFSDLNGTLNTNGANFLLINPNGVVFGSGVKLDVGKAFITSTANGVDFVDAAGRNYNFGVNKAGDAPLIGIDPNVTFNPARLIVGGSIQGSKGIENYGTLQTNNPGQYIGLIGGNVTFNGGQINAPGGRLEFGGLSVPGTVGLGFDGNLVGAQFPTNVARGDVSFTNGAKVSVAGSGGGDIVVNARNVEILGSVLRGGIETGMGTPESVSGDIELNATGVVVVRGANSQVFNNVRLNSTGQGGNIIINAGSFSLLDSAQFQSSIFGRGSAGNVKVTATESVVLADNAAIFSAVEAGGFGKGGNIDITAGALSIQNGAQLLTNIRGASATQPAGQGDAGNVNVKVLGAVDIASKSNVFSSGIASSTEGIGNGGNITINAGSFSLRDGAVLQSSTFGRGNAGNVKVTATDAVVLVDNAAILSTVNAGGVGKGGNIDVTAGSLSIQNGVQLLTNISGASATQPSGQGDAGNVNLKVFGAADIAASAISSSTQGIGNGGNITTNAGSFSLRDGAALQSSTFGRGNAGNVKVTATDAVTFTDADIFSSVELGSVGQGGNIDVLAGSLSLQNGAQLASSIRDSDGIRPAGIGAAGNVNVKVSGAVDFVGKKDIFSSGILSFVGTGAAGTGGNITVDAGSFALRDGAQLSAATYGQGNAGSLTINATDFVTITGKSGSSNSALFVDSQSQTGKAGDLIVSSPQITLDNGGKINAGSFSGNGGNINIKQADLLLLRRGGQITTNAGGTPQSGGNGGNIKIDSKLIVAIPTENSDISANAVKGRGGNVTIDSQGLFGIQFRPQSTVNSDITASSDFNQQGNVQINTPGVDPGKDTGELPAAPNDASRQISQTCNASQRDNKFYITGRGGLPPNASEPQESEALWQDARAAKTKPATTANQPQKLAPPAIGWVFERDGRVRLIAAQTAGGATGTRVVCPNQ
jgi:filamentous hemagglutinin family protein